MPHQCAVFAEICKESTPDTHNSIQASHKLFNQYIYMPVCLSSCNLVLPAWSPNPPSIPLTGRICHAAGPGTCDVPPKASYTSPIYHSCPRRADRSKRARSRDWILVPYHAKTVHSGPWRTCRRERPKMGTRTQQARSKNEGSR